MPIQRCDFITTDFMRANPDYRFLFGDNMKRAGRGGQAKIMRDEPNSVGCPTKHAPSWHPSAFFTDADFDQVKPSIDAAFITLANHLKDGGTVVIPAAGIGTYRAKLPTSAPRIFNYIQRLLQRLYEIAGQDFEPDTDPGQ